jgi:hypothetical protein
MSVPIHAWSKPAYSHLTEFHRIAPPSERAQQDGRKEETARFHGSKWVLGSNRAEEQYKGMITE